MLITLPFIAVGVAILRHNLYDIDIIIRRTLIYSILTAALAALYFGGVVLAQSILRPLTASSDLAIVLSTLALPPCSIRCAIASRTRSTAVSSAASTTRSRHWKPSASLSRDEVDLDKLQAALIGVVQETMQPTKISLWLRES